MVQTDSVQETVSRAPLLKASLGAAIVAGVLLVTVVLPAEYGVDPLGTGKLTGLDRLAPRDADVSGGADGFVAASGTPDIESIARDIPYRLEEITIDLPPHSDTELKAKMKAGDSFVFEWISEGGPVRQDMHGEEPDAGKDEFTSYWDDREIERAKGQFTAPFAGSHGWYWRNKGDVPVTISLRMAGFFGEPYRP